MLMSRLNYDGMMLCYCFFDVKAYYNSLSSINKVQMKSTI